MKYTLSRNITIADTNDFFEGDAPEKYSHGYYILSDERQETDFLINGTIKYFLDKFFIPKTQQEVLQEIEAEVNSDASVFEQTCNTFLKYLIKKNFLVAENTEEPLLSKETLFREGDIIDNYSVLRILSNKSNIDIYLVVDTRNQYNYVLKLLNKNKVSNEHHYQKELKQLEREYEMLYDVKEIPSISHVYGFNKEKELYAYITLEYINGKSLSRYIDEQEPLTKEDCLQIIQGIIYGFSLLHDCKLIHGDIHASNILVLKDKTIKIIDVELSRKVQVENEQVLKFGGVYHYMPPDRINNTTSKKFTTQPDLYSDVYQIGLLIYLILYNTLPFEGFIWEELAFNIKEAEAQYHEESFLNYPVPIPLIAIVKKCLNKKPLDRYANAGEILEEYKNYVFI
ncbi:MAG: serine/threonine-protein kinase [Chitinophagaceae bacterium]